MDYGDAAAFFPAIEGDYEDGKPIAVVLLRPDGSRETVNTPLTCGEWLVNGYGADKTQWVTDTCNKGDSMLLRTEYMTDIGTGNPWMRIDRIVEVEVWSDGRMESRDYTPEGDPDLTVTSPDGKHTANTTPDYSLQIDGTVALQSEPDANIYYEPKLWLDNMGVPAQLAVHQPGKVQIGLVGFRQIHPADGRQAVLVRP